MSRLASLLAVAAFAGLASCYSPNWGGGIACGTGDTCPSGFACFDGTCRDDSERDGDDGQSDGASPMPAECTPAQATCRGRELVTCNANGDGYVQRRACPFTCGEGQCTSASNIPPEDQATCSDDAPALRPPAGATVSFASQRDGRIDCSPHCGDASVTRIEARTVLRDEGPDLIWFCLSDLVIPSGLTISAGSGVTDAIALFVTGRAQIAGNIAVDGGAASEDAGGQGGPGGASGAERAAQQGLDGGGACAGQGGQKAGTGDQAAGGGGGGGGHGSGGGNGGDGRTIGDLNAPGGSGEASPCGVPVLEPLVGGSGGGSGGDGECDASCGWPSGGGGGAIQVAARSGIEVSGIISASGGSGFGNTTAPLGVGGGGGGGSGGAILLEGPSLTIAARTLRVEGGSGGPSLAGPGGQGAGPMTGAGAGIDAAAVSQGGSGGGGGGGGGRVRLNTTGQLTCTGVTSPDGVCTTGPLKGALP